MLLSGHPIRGLLTLLVAVAIPLCCCSFRSAVNPLAVEGVLQGDAPQEPSACCHEDGDGGPGQGSHESERPSGPKKQCSCSKGKATAWSGEKPELQPLGWATPAVLVLADFGAPPVDRGLVPDRSAPGVLKPATSLLRLHCALMI